MPRGVNPVGTEIHAYSLGKEHTLHFTLQTGKDHAEAAERMLSE